jgi:hypothetical protein
MTAVEELEARRALVLKQLGRCRPLIEGSLAVVHRCCGTASCRCHVDDSRRHRQVMLCRKVEGRSYSTHIPKELEQRVREWNDEFKRAKGLLKEISDLSEQIVRGHVTSRRRAARGTGAEGTVQA